MSDQHSSLTTAELSLVIGDNSALGAHCAGYNGIWQISSVHDKKPLFVPTYCGMNFEFIAPMVATDPTEPKDHPIDLSIIEAGQTVELYQAPTPSHRVESWMTYRIAGPAHIDWTFRYRLHDVSAFSNGAAGFFFASYIFEPENKAIYVLSRDVYNALMWIQFCTIFQGKNSAIVWEGDAYDVEFGAHDHGLYTSRAPIRYAVPIMLGRRRDMAFALMFESPTGVVLCHGMGGGGFVADGSDRHPAWDFLLYTPDPVGHRTGHWNGRLVYKKFQGRDNIVAEYRRFQSDLGRNWSLPPYALKDV